MKIVEIFQSIDGEGPRAGKLANFIRLAGCNLRCTYCDTDYAWDDDGAREMSVLEITQQLNSHLPHVTITGGEPCRSFETLSPLLSRLLELDYLPSIETNGSIDLRPFIRCFPQIQYIVDYKSPTSGVNAEMNKHAFIHLNAHDVIKFVVGSIEDLDAMNAFYENTICLMPEFPQLYISPVWGAIDGETIVQYMMEHWLLNFRMQIQLHKVIWDADKKGV